MLNFKYISGVEVVGGEATDPAQGQILGEGGAGTTPPRHAGEGATTAPAGVKDPTPHEDIKPTVFQQQSKLNFLSIRSYVFCPVWQYGFNNVTCKGFCTLFFPAECYFNATRLAQTILYLT